MGDDLCRREFQAQHRPSDVYSLDRDFGPREHLLTWKAAHPCTVCLPSFTSSVSCLWNLLCQILIITYGCYKHGRGAVSGYRMQGFLGLRGPSWGVLADWGLVGGGSHRCGNGLAFGRLGIWWSPVCVWFCVGGVALWLEPWGKSLLGKKIPSIWDKSVRASTDKQGRRCWISFAVDMHLWEWCMFINYLKWTAGTPSVWL